MMAMYTIYNIYTITIQYNIKNGLKSLQFKRMIPGEYITKVIAVEYLSKTKQMCITNIKAISDSIFPYIPE